MQSRYLTIEPIQDIQGWKELSTDKLFTLKSDRNGTEKVEIDAAGDQVVE